YHCLAQMTQFFIYLAWIEQCAADFFPQDRTIPRTQTRRVNTECCSRVSEPLRHFFVGNRCGRACSKMILQRFKQVTFSPQLVLSPQPVERLSSQRSRPFPLEYSICAPMVPACGVSFGF